MAKQTRIGLIQDAISAEGGGWIERNQYFADGPGQFYGMKWVRLDDGTKILKRAGGNKVNYKVYGHAMDLDLAAKERVVERLKAHPDVHDSWIIEGGSDHLRIQFDGVIGN